MDKEYLIKKWLNDDLTDAEKAAFDNLDDSKLNVAIIETSKQFKASGFSDIKDFNTFKKHYNSRKKPILKLQWIKPILQMAAAFIIGFGIYYFAFYNSSSSYKTSISQNMDVVLPDNSKVKLNANSQLQFDDDNWKDNRQVKLKGEAYFIVEKGNKFDVITNDGKVTVVGTEFNVKQRNNYFEVKCFEGIVKVTSNTIERTLHAGDTFQFLNDALVEEKTPLKKPFWVAGVSSFKSVPFHLVVEELKRQYNISVSFENVDLTRQFTGGFNHKNLEHALLSITKPMGLSYELSSSNHVIIHENKE